MSLLQEHNFNSSFGIISELTRISGELISKILKRHQAFTGRIDYVGQLHRLIVHTDPHLDEYFAALLFRACLPPFKRELDFIEQSTYSEDNDQDLISLGPNSAGFGFGGQASGGAKFLALFDEHIKGAGRTERSCSEIVSRMHFKNLPFSIRVILEEINRIDSSGGAHPQHLNNIVKTLHNVRFLFKNANNKKDEIKDFLSPIWKRAVIDASITAVIYCTENRIDLLRVDDSKVASVRNSFEHYCKFSNHKNDLFFKIAYDEIKKNLFNLTKTFNDSNFKDDKKPQSLIISRIAFACDNAWGNDLSKLIMLHYWETLMQGQIIFLKLLDEIKKMHLNNENSITSSLGSIERVIVHDHLFQQLIKTKETFNSIETISYVSNANLNLYEIDPVPSAFAVHKSFTYFLNGKEFKGFGFILINDKFNGTKALFKGNGIPDAIWRKIIDKIKSTEPDLWYEVVASDSNTIAAFILNGNKTHQYVPPSDIDIKAFSNIVRSIR